MKYRLTSGCDIEVLDNDGDSKVSHFKKGTIIDAIVINPEEETKEHFDLRLADGLGEMIGVQKSLFEEYNPSIVKMHNHYVFMGRRGMMPNDDVYMEFSIAIGAYDQETATKKMLELENELSISLRQTFPAIK